MREADLDPLRDAAHGNGYPVSGGFFIGKYEVTQEQWECVMGTHRGSFVGTNLPVEGVNWHECQEFCRRLSARTGYLVQLPPSAEWDYVQRCGRNEEARHTDKKPVARTTSTRSSGVRMQTEPVGSGQPNSLGVYDLEGNVREWCCDRYNMEVEGTSTSSRRQVQTPFRCVRGKSWATDLSETREEEPACWLPETGHPDLGFRVVIGGRAEARRQAEEESVSASDPSSLARSRSLSTRFTLTELSDSRTIHGVTIRLVRHDPDRKSATILVSASTGKKTLTATQGSYFGSGRSIFLERIFPDGIELQYRWAEIE